MKFLEELEEFAAAHHVPIIRMQSREILRQVCGRLSPRRILEIGTAIGYSGILMLEACDATLVTLEKDEEAHALALENFKKAGVSGRVKAVLCDAGQLLPEMLKEEKFDLIFLDGPKAQYIRYLPYLKVLLNRGGVLFADDIYFHGLVKGQEEVARKKRSIVRNLRQFIDALQKDSDFETEFLDIEDGLSISKFI